MRKIGVIPNSEKDVGFGLTTRVVAWLHEKGLRPLITERVGRQTGLTEFIADIQTIYAQSEFLVVLGGDGTILRAARGAAIHATPILGVNMGTLGYLTDVEAAQAFEALEKTVAGNYAVENRLMLEALIMKPGVDSEALIALNEVCVMRSAYSPMITLKLTINGEYIDHYRADGLIVSTPTGSTAYNLSCGGSILKPDSEMIAVSPICPHMIYSRPLVIPAGDVVNIQLTQSAGAEGIITQDGQNHSSFAPGDAVTIRRSKYHAAVIKTTGKSFFDVLRHKLVRNFDDRNDVPRPVKGDDT